MENFLRSKEYWGLIEGGIAYPTGGVSGVVLSDAQKKVWEDQKLKDLKAKNYLFQAIDRTILETILERDTSKQIWDSLKKKYQGSARVKRAQLQALRKEFEVIHMKEGETVIDYFSRVFAIANKMKIHGDKTEDVTIVEKILRSMATKFAYVVCSIEESNDVDELSVDELQSSLLVHEQRMGSNVIEEQALKVATYGESATWRGSGIGRGWNKGRGRGRNSVNPADKSGIECYRCHKLGHYRYECPIKFNTTKEENSNFVETEEEVLLMAYHDNEVPLSNKWYLDSGCSNHMCGNKTLFSELDESYRDTVKLGNNTKIIVMGRGDIKLKIRDHTVTISGVFYVPELKSNLLSIGQLQEKEFAIIIQGNCCQIRHPKKGLIAQVNMTANRLFPLHIGDDMQTCLSSRIQDATWLWHFRYGHLNFNGLRTLQQRNMMLGLPQITCPSRTCEECVMGKQHRDPFPRRNAWRAKEVLQLIHSDICGPINPVSNDRKRYFITFSLMTIAEKHGYTSWKKSVRPLLCSKPSKL